MRQIQLTNGPIALVDDGDFELVSQWKWWKDGRYAVRNLPLAEWLARGGRGVPRRLLMHRVILNAPPGQDIDHRDGNGLNNTRANLRFCNDSQNQANRVRLRPGRSSRYRGVTLHPTGKWQASIKVQLRVIYLGLFASEEAAARAYDAAAVKHFGDFARPNFEGAA